MFRSPFLGNILVSEAMVVGYRMAGLWRGGKCFKVRMIHRSEPNGSNLLAI
jgi:hypothetical protein